MRTRKLSDLGLMCAPPWQDPPDGPDTPESEEREACPMGCGGVTEDVYGGPCYDCWAEVYAAEAEGRGPHA